MKHIDLFSGIGGFALAVDTVWPGSEHIFCDFDQFCQKVLNKHWPQSKIYGDIRTLTNPQSGQDDGRKSGELAQAQQEQKSGHAAAGTGHKLTSNARGAEQRGLPDSARQEIPAPWSSCDILTGGFPCQPFSAAGKRKGTEDNRYLWPEMFRIISTFKPTWVIAENVRGLVTWNDGLVLEQVCTDLERQGYEVQPLIIPAVAVNAPHRRDRIWFIAHAGQLIPRRSESRGNDQGSPDKFKRSTKTPYIYSNRSGFQKCQRQNAGTEKSEKWASIVRSWDENWFEVATQLCGVDDGLPAELDGFKLTKAGHRAARLKALGNAILPQVAIEIMKAIKYADPKL